MNISVKDAQNSLQDVAKVGLDMQRSILATYASGYMILWGVIWAVAFSLTHFMPENAGQVWMVMAGIGVTITIIISVLQNRQGGKFKNSDDKKLGWRIMGFWFFLSVYTVVWVLLLKPVTGIQMGAFITTVVMFAYVVKGLWFESNYILALGLIVSAVTLIGYYLVPDYFSLWMALAGGGALLVCGLYMRLRWM